MTVDLKQPLVVLFAASPHGAANISSIVLGQHPRVFPTGELRNFPFGNQIIESRTCSCKVVSTNCSFWQRVVDRYAEFGVLPEDERVPHLYRIVAEESGRNVIADVAQDSDWAERLCRNPRLNVRLVHVIRDRQAIVNARLRHRSEGPRYTGWRLLLRTAKATRRLNRHVNRLRSLQAELGPRATSLDYERLCSDPVPTLDRLGTFLSLDLNSIAARITRGEPLSNAPHLLRGGTKFGDKIMLRYDDRFRRQVSFLEDFVFRIANALP